MVVDMMCETSMFVWRLFAVLFLWGGGILLGSGIVHYTTEAKKYPNRVMHGKDLAKMWVGVTFGIFVPIGLMLFLVFN